MEPFRVMIADAFFDFLLWCAVGGTAMSLLLAALDRVGRWADGYKRDVPWLDEAILKKIVRRGSHEVRNMRRE